VNCSAFEAQLDEYVEMSLLPGPYERVRVHVASCESCAALVSELNAIDALLRSAPRIEPPVNFTFKAMAEIRSLPLPRVRRTPSLAIVAAYLACAWLAVAAWFAFGSQSAHAALASLSQIGTSDASAIAALGNVTTRLFGHATGTVTALVSAVLAIDVVALVALVALYTFVRPRLLARIAQTPETR